MSPRRRRAYSSPKAGCTPEDLGLDAGEVCYIPLTGRARDMIIRGGENVYSPEVEESFDIPS
jgi:acyl-CoA synthetase (AMP-forming)/AMP-acid ligase II